MSLSLLLLHVLLNLLLHFRAVSSVLDCESASAEVFLLLVQRLLDLLLLFQVVAVLAVAAQMLAMPVEFPLVDLGWWQHGRTMPTSELAERRASGSLKLGRAL